MGFIIKGWSKKHTVAAVALSVASLFLFLRLLIIPAEPDLPPPKVIEKAIAKTSEATSYRYDTEVKTIINGEESYVSRISGAKGGSDRVHIKGNVVNSEVEFYQVGDTTYMKDQLSRDWVVLKGNNLEQSETQISELNPLANLRYRELKESSYKGKDDVDGAGCWVYEAIPVIQNPYLDFLWTDFSYRLWIEPRGMVLRKAVVEAKSKNTEDGKYIFEARFYDFGEKITINPPTQAP